MTLQLEIFGLGPFATNTILAWCDETREALLFDPALDAPEVMHVVEKHKLLPRGIMLTHGHADHLAGVDWFRNRLGCPIAIGAGDAPMLDDADLNLSSWLGVPFTLPPADRLLSHGDKIRCGQLEAEVVHVPGHTPGGIAFVFPTAVIAGDTLFSGGIGRSDLPGGDGRLLVKVIRERLLTLSDRPVYPGHGPITTLAAEQAGNPFLAD